MAPAISPARAPVAATMMPVLGRAWVCLVRVLGPVCPLMLWLLLLVATCRIHLWRVPPVVCLLRSHRVAHRRGGRHVCRHALRPVIRGLHTVSRVCALAICFAERTKGQKEVVHTAYRRGISKNKKGGKGEAFDLRPKWETNRPKRRLPGYPQLLYW